MIDILLRRLFPEKFWLVAMDIMTVAAYNAVLHKMGVPAGMHS
jgi:hypothetical protein